MTEPAAPYEDGEIECERAGCHTRFVPKHDNHRCCSGPCRAALSRQRQHERGPGRIAGCRMVKGGHVSVTVHLPPEHADRIDELAPGRWAHVTPWSAT